MQYRLHCPLYVGTWLLPPQPTIPYMDPPNNSKWEHIIHEQMWQKCPTGVDHGGIPLSRAHQISRRNTRFAGTVIRPGYQFLPRFGDLILGLASLSLTNMCKQIKQIRITLMKMLKVYTSPPNEVSTEWSRPTLIWMRWRGTRGSVALFILRVWLHALCCVLGRCDALLPNLLIALKSAVRVPT